MITRGKRIAAWIAAVLVALVVILVIVIALFDWNRAKPWIDDRVSQALGRPFVINGDLSVHWQRNPDADGVAAWLPWPRFTARDIAIANPDWAKAKQFATLQQIQFSLSPVALFAHDIIVPSLKLTAPQVDLERDAKDRANWTFMLDHGPSQWKLKLQDIVFDKGTVTIDDRRLRLHLKIAIDPLGKPVPFDQVAPPDTAQATPGNGPTGAGHASSSLQPYYFGWRAKGTYNGAPASGSGKIGSVLALQNPHLPFPLQADLRLADIHIALAGTLTDPADLAALNLRLKLSGSNMAHLYALTGVTLPDTPPFSTEGHLTGRLHRHASVFHYNGFNGKVGGSDLHGAVTYTTAPPRPKLTGVATSSLLRLSDLGPLIGAGSGARKAQSGGTSPQTADKVLPAEPFRTDRWTAMDADVSFSGKRIVRSAALPIQDLSTHLVLDDGVLSLDPLRFGIAGGDLDADVHLDGRTDPLKGKLKLSAQHMKLNKMFPTVKLMQTSLGEANGDAALSATGNSIAALFASANGEVKLLVNDGAISDTLMEEAGLNVANIIINKVFGDKTVRINCAVADFVARDGVLSSRLFVFDTEDATIDIDGTIDFASEKLDLTLHPHSKGIRLLSLRSPLYARGTFSHPDIGVEKGPLLARAAGAVALGTVAAPLAALAALVAPSHDNQNQCAGLIMQMRHKPVAPAPGRTAPAKPAAPTH